MDFTRWYLVIGALLILLVVTGALFRRLPLSTSMLYLVVGWALGWFGWLELGALWHTDWMERLSELAVILSLFSAGLKLRVPLRSRLWWAPVALAFGSMTFTVGLIALGAYYLLGLPLGAAVILGAVLAPTDPVLASDVQVEHPKDEDRVRFTLTGEAGLNDGTAFPFIMLGLGLLGVHDLGTNWSRWWAVDLGWAVFGGIGVGALLGMAVGRLVVYLRRIHREAVGLDDFLSLGLIALAYGAALLVHAYGFLAVFAAGLGLRAVERRLSGPDAPADVKAAAGADEELASHPHHAPAFMAAAVLQFNEQMERLAGLTLVLVVGALLARVDFQWVTFASALVLLFVIRPLVVLPVAVVCGFRKTQTLLLSWFGVRGIGSVYYLYYAINHGLAGEDANFILAITLSVIALSVLFHGVTVTPLMRFYERQEEKQASAECLAEAPTISGGREEPTKHRSHE